LVQLEGIYNDHLVQLQYLPIKSYACSPQRHLTSRYAQYLPVDWALLSYL